MGPIDEESLGQAVARDITPMVYTPIGDRIDRLAAERRRPVPIQICVDTGLGREGVPHRSAAALIQDLLARRGVEIAGVMTVMSEDPELDREQITRLENLVDPLRAAGAKLGPRHAASSFGLFGDAGAFLDQVRPGMALWGVYSELRFRDTGLMDLRPVGALRARVSYVKQLAAGESAGYERAFLAKEPTWVATVPMGHVDGVPRIAAKGAGMRINDRLSPIVAVSASHTIVALGSQPTCRAGDVATLFDWNPGSRPEELAAACGASVYDLMMHLDPTLPRRLV
jgi:alanine racemase